ncbi:hypothetical protein Pfo_017879 [Paulownia fortunei]|nr:hypothetical protein Pfo_017879 [Paulownia fortunei]
MYKSKLQELCQKQKWALPKYTCMRDGEDHCPLFKASVVVSGITFDNPAACRSSKQAYNEAAQVAFIHFTSEPSNQRSEYVEKTNNEKEVQSSMYSEDLAVKHCENRDLQNEFKKKLQMYAQRKNLDLPVYYTEKEGLCFRARVSIGEDWFQSPGLCETVEEAGNAAAQAALLSLSTDAFHENDPRSYKILLQELTDNEGFFLPTYTTIRSDESHCQTFSSTVEVGGEVFQGAAAKSKKLAELNAAKAAYTVFMERKLFQPGYFSPRSSGDDILKLAPRLGSVIISDPQENPKSGSPSNFSSSVKHETEGQDTIDRLTGSAKKMDTSPLRTADCSMKKTTEMKSYLLCNRVKVFTCIPNIELPKGTVVLPISENRWTMVSLEFPCEKGM